MKSAGIFGLWVVLAACRGDAPAPVIPPAAAPAPTPSAPAAPAPEALPAAALELPTACTLQAPTPVANVAAIARGLALAHTAEGYLAAWPSSEASVTTHALGRDGRPAGEPHLVAIANALDVRALYPFGARYLLMNQGVCADRVRMEKCAQLIVLDSAGRATSAALEDRTKQWLEVVDWRAEADAVHMLRRYEYIAPELIAYRADTSGGLAREVVLDLHAYRPEDGELLGGSAEPRASFAIIKTDQALRIDRNGARALAPDESAESMLATTQRSTPSAAARAALVELNLQHEPRYAALSCDDTSTDCGILWSKREGQASAIAFSRVRCGHK